MTHERKTADVTTLLELLDWLDTVPPLDFGDTTNGARRILRDAAALDADYASVLRALNDTPCDHPAEYCPRLAARAVLAAK